MFVKHPYISIIFFSSFLVYLLYVVCECVPSVIFPVQRTTSEAGDRPNQDNVITTTTRISSTNRRADKETLYFDKIRKPSCPQLILASYMVEQRALVAEIPYRPSADPAAPPLAALAPLSTIHCGASWYCFGHFFTRPLYEIDISNESGETSLLRAFLSEL